MRLFCNFLFCGNVNIEHISISYRIIGFDWQLYMTFIYDGDFLIVYIVYWLRNIIFCSTFDFILRFSFTFNTFDLLIFYILRILCFALREYVIWFIGNIDLLCFFYCPFCPGVHPWFLASRTIRPCVQTRFWIKPCADISSCKFC